ncbi:MAG: S8 family peptidase [Myxococcaceae bacterium]|nr:S8 family peptidase [Myxococcaceae bacterium]
MKTRAARDELATREIIAVRPAPGSKLAKEQLDDATDAWLIGVVPDTGVVLLDVASADMGYLREKLAAYADDAQVVAKTKKDGTPKLDEGGAPVMARAAENAVAPVESLGLAILEDVSASRLRSDSLAEDRSYWFEIACRGGYRRPEPDTVSSRSQIARQLHVVGAGQQLDELIGPEQVYFFVQLTSRQLEGLRATTDCIYEVDLAPPAIRDLKLADAVYARDLKSFQLTPPPNDAPSVVVLDTGIATEHPLLKPAMLTPTVAGPEIPTVEDTHGHGTQMAGIALYPDLGASLERGSATASHWVQSSRILVRPLVGTATKANDEKWPVLTLGAVRAAELADPSPRNRVFALAVTRSMQEAPFTEPVPTLWGHAVDQVAYADGSGRLMMVSAGNARETQYLVLADQHPQLQLSEKIHEPAQATNAVTVGAYTERIALPHGANYAEYGVVAQKRGGISPFTSVGPGGDWAIKPDVVMEGGNLAVAGALYDSAVDTLSALTTQRTLIAGRALTTLNMTSEATARASHLAARIWASEPKLKPESVRALIVHSASWTPTMKEQFEGINDRLQACGYGVPDERIASECAHGVATVVVEDVMPNAVIEEEPKKEAPKRPTSKATESKTRRKAKIYRVPIPSTLISLEDPNVDLRVTLSYFAEPNKFGRSVFHGLDLKWDMQGPQESEQQFLERVNPLKRLVDENGKRLPRPKTNSFKWEIGPQRRGRGTVQSDRWSGKMSALAGDKLIAVVPVLGWWEQRRALKLWELNFSLVVSIFGPGVYAAIKPLVELPIEAHVEV